MYKTFALFLAFFFFGCSQPANSPQALRADARAAVLSSMNAWKLAATACIDFSLAAKIDNSKCAAVLDPAHDAIVEAALVVDALAVTDKVPASVFCNLQTAAKAVLSVPGLLPPLVTQDALPFMADALTVADKLGVCPKLDAGNGG